MDKLRICAQPFIPQDNSQLKTMRMQSFNPVQKEKLQAAFFTSKLWPRGSTIRIQFLELKGNAQWSPLSNLESLAGGKNNLDPLELELRKLPTYDLVIKKILTERLAPIVDLKFVFVDSNADIRIGFDASSGAWSLLGTDVRLGSRSEKTMNHGWIDVGTIIHEFGHAIGLIHEHQNPKGGVKWNVQKVLQWAKQSQGWDEQTTRRNIIDAYDLNSVNATDFDPHSIMLYFFPASLTTDNKGTKPNFRLSPEDVKHIHKIYQGSVSPNEFYKRIYGKNINTMEDDTTVDPPKEVDDGYGKGEEKTSTSTDNKSASIWFIVLIVVIIVILVYICMRCNRGVRATFGGRRKG